MITILHGDNIVQSRKTLVEIISSAKNNNKKVVRLDAKKLILPDLEQTLGSDNLFGESKIIIIEALHSLARSKKRTAFITLIANSQSEIVLWEKKAITASNLKAFSKANVKNFKLTNTLFSWLDSLQSGQTPKLKMFHIAIKNNGEQMCLAMLSRQIRLLIQAKENQKIKGPPFMISKLKRQVQSFNLNKLTQILQQLYQIDKEFKTSQNQLSVSKTLDLLLLKM